MQGSNSPEAVAYRKKAMDEAVKWLRHQLLVTGNASQMKVSDKPITTGNAKSIPGLGKFGHFKVPDMKPTTKIVKAKDLKAKEGKR